MFRKSKFKHVFGKPLKKEQCYDNIRITKSGWDSSFCDVNPKYLAIITEAAGGGAFLVLPLEKVGRIERDCALVAGHKAPVLDLQWCPHDDDIIASASEDCTIKVWQISSEFYDSKTNLTEPLVDLVAHQRRVGLIQWHPTAQNVLMSAGADNKVFIWNLDTADILVEIDFPDMITSAAFNFNGSRLACTCKDRVTRVVDPRTGDVLQEGNCHDGHKPQRVIYVSGDRIFTTGFSRMSERQYALWNDNDLSNALTIQDLDTSNGVMFPFYDYDTNLVFLCGKGDSVIRYFEIGEEDPYVHYIDMYKSSEPQRGMGVMPKRGLDVNQCEIARFYKLHGKGLCEVIPFTVPRKSELFQEDLYPDTAGCEAALSAADWINGQDSDPVMISLRDMYTGAEAGGTRKAGAVNRSLVSKKLAEKKAAAAAPAPSEKTQSRVSSTNSATTEKPTVTERNNSRDNDEAAAVCRLTAMERRIEELEQRVQKLESDANAK